MAEEGRGEVEYVSLNDDGSAAARRFHERVRNPLLTDISIDWGGLEIADVYPKRIPDLFSAKPVIVCGRYKSDGRGVIRLQGKMAGRPFAREIEVDLPKNEPRRDVLATLWARARIDDLMSQDYAGIQSGAARDDVRESITQLGLEFRLMTQFTSFVAVEEMTITDGGQPRRVEVPVEMPEGVSHRGVFGEEVDAMNYSRGAIGKLHKAANAPTGYVGALGGGAGQPPSPPVVRAERPKEQRRIDKDDSLRSVLSPNDVKRQQMLSKLHQSVAAVVERLKKKDVRPAADEARFVRNGKAEIQVWLSDKSAETLAQLKRLGFEVVLDPKSAKMLIGRLAIEKLEALAELKAVRYVAPMTQ